MSNLAKTSVKSSWTPLNNEQTNQKIFEERRALVNKWFEKWTDGQRKVVLAELLEQCKLKQIAFAAEIVNHRKPQYHQDFTRHLPRVLSLYIFSFLDPRSLCRCSQVCWFWRFLTELDQLWMPKCVKLGWVLSFSPTPYEAGVWKRLYIENIVSLKCLTPKVAKGVVLQDAGDITSRSQMTTSRPDSRTGRYTPHKPKPWRGSDPVPKDIWRNNILDNKTEMEKINKMRARGVFGKETQEMSLKATNKVNTNTSPPKRPSSVPRSKSVPGLNNAYPMPATHRPDWAKAATIGSPADYLNQSQSGDIDPRTALNGNTTPMQTVKLGGKAHRTPRDPPSSNLFPESPWKVPDEEYDSDVY